MLEVNNIENDSKYIYVTVDKNNIVWYSHNNYRAVSSNTGIEDFAESSEFIKSRNKFRIIGTPQNLRLINKLFVKKCLGRVHSIEICSPNIIKRCDDIGPEQIIFILRTIKRNPAVGRWYSISPLEYPIYLMVEKVTGPQSKFNIKVAEYLVKFHPAWKEINFISPININSLINIIKYIVDPRWFINVRKPNSFSKIEKYFGLMYNNIDFVLNEIRKKKSEENKRLHSLIGLWYPNLIDEFDCENNPQHFVYRIYKFFGIHALGILKTSRCVLKYIILNWLEKLNYLRYGKKGIYFIPEHFFYRLEEVQAYYQHLNRDDSK